VAGSERPFLDAGESGLDPLRHGDLQMTLLVSESHGLRVGADVQYRGILVGDVRGVELSENGTHVEVAIRIQQKYRTTVTDKSVFWIARPRVSGALLRGIAIEDLGAFLGPFVGYHTERRRGAPVPDGYRLFAQSDRPSIADDQVPQEALQGPIPKAEPESNGGIQLARVIYEAEDEDWFSRNDHERRTGTGLVFVDSAGRSVVLTARSLCDATYFMTDAFGTAPDIKAETIRVVIPGGTVFRAGRSWVDPAGGDLALLVLENVPPDLPATPLELLVFDGSSTGAHMIWNAGGEPCELDLTRPESAATSRGAAVVRDGRVVGILGQRNGRESIRTVQELALLPESLRPSR
jgi:hypothetical protein